jgi:hypothetical protein
MQVQSAYRGLAHDDAGDFKVRVEESMAKLKGSTGVVTEPQGNAVDPKAGGATPEPVKGTVNVASNPPGADVRVDGELVGNTPAVLRLTPDKHTLTMKITGYKEWSREVTVQSRSEVQVTANLEK